MGNVTHNCGFAVAPTLHTIYALLKDLQHRGKEVVGIGGISRSGGIDVIKWRGLVEAFDLRDLDGLLPRQDYHTFIGHVRYATRGQKEHVLDEGHPHVIGGTRVDCGTHIYMYDADAAIVHNGQVDMTLLEKHIDRAALRTGCDTEALLYYYKNTNERAVLANIPGSFTMAIADRTKKDVMILRDRTAIKPGVLSFKDGKYIVTSEDIAAKKNGAEIIEHLEPGVVYYLTPDGQYRKERVVPSLECTIQHCFFEGNYIADKDSEIVEGVPVGTLRRYLGEELAREFGHVKADVAVYVPRCPQGAARAFSSATGITLDEHILYKRRGSDRSFFGSTPAERESSIGGNLNLNPQKIPMLRGATIIVVDDSTIRGNVARRVIRLFDSAGVKSLHYLNYTPRQGIIGDDGNPRGCMMGVDMPLDDDFIARNRTAKEIGDYLREQTGAAMEVHMHYLSVDGMFRAFERLGQKREQFCHFCIGGPKPF